MRWQRKLKSLTGQFLALCRVPTSPQAASIWMRWLVISVWSSSFHALVDRLAPSQGGGPLLIQRSLAAVSRLAELYDELADLGSDFAFAASTVGVSYDVAPPLLPPAARPHTESVISWRNSPGGRFPDESPCLVR